MPVEHCLQNDTRPVKTSFTPLISVISVCFEYPSCTLQSFQHVIDFNLRVKIAVRILCTLPASLCGVLMGKKFTVWPWIFSLLELEPLLFFSALGQLVAWRLPCLVCYPSFVVPINNIQNLNFKPLVCHEWQWSNWSASYAALYESRVNCPELFGKHNAITDLG